MSTIELHPMTLGLPPLHLHLGHEPSVPQGQWFAASLKVGAQYNLTIDIADQEVKEQCYVFSPKDYKCTASVRVGEGPDSVGFETEWGSEAGMKYVSGEYQVARIGVKVTVDQDLQVDPTIVLHLFSHDTAVIADQSPAGGELKVNVPILMFWQPQVEVEAYRGNVGINGTASVDLRELATMAWQWVQNQYQQFTDSFSIPTTFTLSFDTMDPTMPVITWDEPVNP